MGPRIGSSWVRQLPVTVRALAFAVDHVAAPAFVVVAPGRVVAVNQIGRAWFGERANARAVVRAGGPDRSAFDVLAFAIAGATYYFAVLRPPAPAPRVVARLPRAVAWGLTRRESEVAARILRGETNRRIAGELGCALKTVEHHVSAILRKAKVPSRARLILAAREQ